MLLPEAPGVTSGLALPAVMLGLWGLKRGRGIRCGLSASEGPMSSVGSNLLRLKERDLGLPDSRRFLRAWLCGPRASPGD